MPLEALIIIALVCVVCLIVIGLSIAMDRPDQREEDINIFMGAFVLFIVCGSLIALRFTLENPKSHTIKKVKVDEGLAYIIHDQKFINVNDLFKQNFQENQEILVKKVEPYVLGIYRKNIYSYEILQDNKTVTDTDNKETEDGLGEITEAERDSI